MTFPKHEQFGLTNQVRRAVVSAASNIVEGCARSTEGDYLRFLDIAYGSVREVEYQLSLAFRLNYLSPEQYQMIHPKALETSKVLGALIRAIRGQQ
jgi:four helix bundle protein